MGRFAARQRLEVEKLGSYLAILNLCCFFLFGYDTSNNAEAQGVDPHPIDPSQPLDLRCNTPQSKFLLQTQPLRIQVECNCSSVENAFTVMLVS
jgi:hypothetical protein